MAIPCGSGRPLRPRFTAPDGAPGLPRPRGRADSRRRARPGRGGACACRGRRRLSPGRAVGVGQSMYEIARYASVNDMGTATLLEALVEGPVERLVVASSMSIYGEGLHGDRRRARCRAAARSPNSSATDWGSATPGRPLSPCRRPRQPPSRFDLRAHKHDQEGMCLMPRAYGIPTVALRFFNVYGPRQALSNPYTGVLAIFSTRLLRNRAAHQRGRPAAGGISSTCTTSPRPAGLQWRSPGGRRPGVQRRQRPALHRARQVAEQMGKVPPREGAHRL